MSDSEAIRRYPQRAEVVRALPTRPDPPTVGAQLLAVLGALGAVAAQLALFMVCAPFAVLLLVLIWQITH